MDLRAWILAEIDATTQRMQNQVLARMPDDVRRVRPGEQGASLAWMLFHTAYHHDVAINAVVLGGEPIFAARRAALGLGSVAAGTGMGEADDEHVRTMVELGALSGYWRDVYVSTCRWVASVDLADLDRVPDAREGLAGRAGVPDTTYGWLFDLWEGKPASFFLQWEAIGHVQNHLGEAIALRNRLGLSPF